MGRDNREVEKTLLSKFAFTRAASKSVDHRWLQLALPGLPIILTKFSHTREDIGDGLWKKIASQVHVQANYLSGMVDCRNSREDYYEQVRANPQPPWAHLTQRTSSVSAAQNTKHPAKIQSKARKK